MLERVMQKKNVKQNADANDMTIYFFFQNIFFIISIITDFTKTHGIFLPIF